MTRFTTTVDELGTGVTVPVAPRRVVSLVPNLSELLWFVGAAEQVAGVTDWCVAPPHGFPGAARVRGTKNPDIAAIVALEPDLVIANAEENRRLDVERLRDAGLAVFVTSPRSYDEAAETIVRVAGLVDAGGRGRGVADAMYRARDAVRHGRRFAPVTAFCAVWRDPWMATGGETFAGSLLEEAGFRLVPGGARYPQVDLAAIAAMAPEAVLLPDEPYAFSDADRPAFAGWSGRVRLIDGTGLSWYGPRTPYALRELTRLAGSIARRR